MIVKVIVACAAFAAAAHASGVATAYANRVDLKGPDLAVGIGRGDNDGWQGWDLGRGRDGDRDGKDGGQEGWGRGRDGDRDGKDGGQEGWGRGRGGDNNGWQGWDLGRGRDGDRDGKDGGQEGWGRGRGGDNDGWQGWDSGRGRDGNWDGRQGWDWGGDGRDGNDGKDGRDGRWGGWAGHGKPLATKTGSLWKYFGPHVPVVIGDNWNNNGKNDLGRGGWGGRP